MESATRTRPQIVMVEDDGDFQSILRGWLAPRFDTISFADGEELLGDLSTLRPDLIILDVNLPGPDGFKLCEKIRGDGRFAWTPILFLTGLGGNEDFLKHMQAGGTAYLTKPVDRLPLLAEIDSLLADTFESELAATD